MTNWGEIKRQLTECEWPSIVIQNGLYALGFYLMFFGPDSHGVMGLYGLALGVISALYGVYCLGLDGFQRLMRRFE